jgi:hypothetical protein
MDACRVGARSAVKLQLRRPASCCERGEAVMLIACRSDSRAAERHASAECVVLSVTVPLSLYVVPPTTSSRIAFVPQARLAVLDLRRGTSPSLVPTDIARTKPLADPPEGGERSGLWPQVRARTHRGPSARIGNRLPRAGAVPASAHDRPLPRAERTRRKRRPQAQCRRRRLTPP